MMEGIPDNPSSPPVIFLQFLRISPRSSKKAKDAKTTASPRNRLAISAIATDTVALPIIPEAIATATAPGPIVAVVKNFRTKGPVTDVLLPLVALDDAIGIMLFAMMLSLGTTLLGISGTVSATAIILDPLLEIIISIFIGLVLGLILSYIVKKFNRESDSMLLMMTLGIIFAGIGIGQVPIVMNFFGLHQSIYLSAILLPMTIGVVLTNRIDDAFEKRLTKNTDLFSAPILLGFFTLAGAELDLSALVRAISSNPIVLTIFSFPSGSIIVYTL